VSGVARAGTQRAAPAQPRPPRPPAHRRGRGDSALGESAAASRHVGDGRGRAAAGGVVRRLEVVLLHRRAYGRPPRPRVLGALRGGPAGRGCQEAVLRSRGQPLP
jgi:hypothetical protein